jgi:hypothetical protein
MISYIDIRPIIADHFYPFHFRKGRQFSWPRTVLTVILPAAGAIALSFRHPVIAEKYQVTFLTVFGLIGAVMTALLPIVQSVVGVSLRSERYTLAQKHLWNQQKVRLEVLRGLYSSICMSVIYLVFSLVPLIALQINGLPFVAKQAIAAMIYFVGLAVATCFLEVISGVYLVLDAHAAEVDKELERLSPPDPNESAV